MCFYYKIKYFVFLLFCVLVFKVDLTLSDSDDDLPLAKRRPIGRLPAVSMAPVAVSTTTSGMNGGNVGNGGNGNSANAQRSSMYNLQQKSGTLEAYYNRISKKYVESFKSNQEINKKLNEYLLNRLN